MAVGVEAEVSATKRSQVEVTKILPDWTEEKRNSNQRPHTDHVIDFMTVEMFGVSCFRQRSDAVILAETPLSVTASQVESTQTESYNHQKSRNVPFCFVALQSKYTK